MSVAVAVAVAVSVLCTLAAVGVFLCLCWKLAAFRHRWTSKMNGSFRLEVDARDELPKFGKNVKALIVEEDGVDVLYLRKLEDGQLGTGFPKVVLNPGFGDECSEEEKRVDGSTLRMQRSESREALLRCRQADAAPFQDNKPVPNTRIPIPLRPLALPPALPPPTPEPMDLVIVPAKHILQPELVIEIPVPEKSLYPPLPPTRSPTAPARVMEKQTPPPVVATEIPVSEKSLHPPLPPTVPPTVPVRVMEKQTPPPAVTTEIPVPEKSLHPPILPTVPLTAPVRVMEKQTPPPAVTTEIPDPEKSLHPPIPPTVPLTAPVSVMAKQTPPPAPTQTSSPSPSQPPPPPPPPPPPLPPVRGWRVSRLPPTRAGISALRLKRPLASRGRSNRSRASDTIPTDQASRSDSSGPAKLKPLHWDKITAANTDHSVVWDDINDGSLRFDDGLIETLFGYTNNGNRRIPGNGGITVPTSSDNLTSAPASQNSILEPRKSQNAAIILKSLTISRREIVEALLDGQGLSADDLEKLTKIAPTQKEASKILQFDGRPDKLSGAESFLYHILKAVPSAFTRLNAMLFKLNYDSDILHLKESLQILELGCKELRTRGLFLKLLEAILKAGNRMNAGTARGNAQGFKLSALEKLYDVKSTDGKTTLLHFVVEQVVRSEGRRLSSTRTLPRLDLGSLPNDEKEKEFLLLGLQELGSFTKAFSNVRKAATIEYGSFINMCSSLSNCVAEIRNLVSGCDNGERGGFLREMKQFLEGCREELKVVREEQARVTELVRRTMDYYQAGASKDNGLNPFQLFIIIKNFLHMVDRVKTDITQRLQKNSSANSGSSPPQSPPARSPPRFLNARLQLVKNIMPRATYSSESEDDFE